MRNIITLFLLFISLFGSLSIQAQSDGACGVDYKEGLSIKEKMLQNRARISPQLIQQLQNQRNTLWVPVVLHIIGSDDGEGYASPSNAVQMICRLNKDFADQNIQFYIKGDIQYHNDEIIYVNAYDSVAIDRMILLKDTTAANIFINGSAGGGIAGYYSRRGDYVFMLNGYANGSSTTITHEFGHFFTLPHTFFGWEGTDARQLYGTTPAPDSLGNPGSWRRRAVEYVTRTGPLANCSGAGDGFCDTPADYISDRTSCPLVGNALDPSGVDINPNPDFYMSYFSDNCMDSFSTEQKGAIMADLIDRNWTNFPGPPNLDSLSPSNISPIQPLNGATASFQSAGNTIRIEWDTTGASSATAWVLLVERMIFGTPVATTARIVVNNQNYYDLPKDKLANNSTYRWSVMPFSSGYHCAGFSPSYSFETDVANGLANAAAPQELATLRLMPNPVKEGVATIGIVTLRPLAGELRVYSMDGRLLAAEGIQQYPAGEQVRHLNLSNLTNGHYQLVFITEQGSTTQHFQIAR